MKTQLERNKEVLEIEQERLRRLEGEIKVKKSELYIVEQMKKVTKSLIERIERRIKNEQ